MPRKTFEAWMREVDAALLARVGLDNRDLPDIAYYDLWEDGVTPKGAAGRAIRYAKGGDW